MIPEDRVYSKHHMWVKVGSECELGLTAPFLKKLEPLITIDLPDPDDEMKVELPFGEVEGARQTVQLFPPVEGRVTAVNDKLVWDHAKLAKDPYGAGWLIRFTAHNAEDLKSLWNSALYRAYVADVLGKGSSDG